MKITLLLTGISDDRELSPVIERYVGRIAHYGSFEVKEIKAAKHFAKLAVDDLKKEEGKLILECIGAQDKVVLLDERGKDYSSPEFAAQLQQWMNSGGKRIVFVVGGAFGFSEAVYERADHLFALSSLTLTHQMVRLFFVEQLYRAFTILRNEKYHH